MKPVTLLAWASLAVAAFLIFLFLNSGQIAYLSAAISSGIAGVVFLAIQQVIDLLTDIRDTLQSGNRLEGDAGQSTPLPVMEPRSLDEIGASIEGAKKRHPAA